MKYLLLFIASIFGFISVAGQDIDILTDITIELRDGVKLNATLYKPHEQKEPLPVIFTLTPYISDTYHERGRYFAKHGYVFAIVDVRGRGSSEGNFTPFLQEAKDGYDIVEWLATQPYSNGKITMWGGSYAGYNQWATAKELPPHLKTIVPVAAAKMGIDFPMVNNNIGQPYVMQWRGQVNNKTPNLKLFSDDEFWICKFTERYKKDIPFNKLDSLVGNRDKTFQEWILHPSYDNYWKSFVPTEQQYSKMDLPILSINGCYDGDQPGSMSYYKEFMQYGTASAKNKHYLIIGPWDHAGTRTPSVNVGGLTFGDSALVDMNDLHKQWYDFTLKEGPKPTFLKNKVAYFVTNRNKWKYASSLEDIGKEKQIYYLNSGNNKHNDVIHSAFLNAEPPGKNDLPAEYVYDPLDKRYGALEQIVVNNYLTNQTHAYNLGDGGVIYHSAPFETETEISGFFELKAYIETDVKDIDIAVEIYEIKSNGESVFLTSDAIRARYRENREQEKLLKPEEINLFHFNGFYFISRAIEKGSRLRLVISSPNSIYAQKNYCSGGIIAYETGKDAHTAHVKIYNNIKYPSILIVPVVK